MLDCFDLLCRIFKAEVPGNTTSTIAGPNGSRLGHLYEMRALSDNHFQQARGVIWCIPDHFLLFHALMPKVMATMTEIEGRITPIMI